MADGTRKEHPLATAFRDRDRTRWPDYPAHKTEQICNELDRLHRCLDTLEAKHDKLRAERDELLKVASRLLDCEQRWICLLYTSPSPRDS